MEPGLSSLGLPVSHSEGVPLPSLGPRNIFIACAPDGPHSQPLGLGWNVVSLAPSSLFVYFIPVHRLFQSRFHFLYSNQTAIKQ